MSGIVGVLNRSGAPVDRELLLKMTRFLEFRGPDAQEVWVDGAVGFGQTLLRTTWESRTEKQPCTLDGEVWITADVRLDGRQDLVRQLLASGSHPAKDATDPELILYAYRVWKEDCAAHLLGDFSFAIWDARHQTLFCGRDHLGIKPFYYSEAAGNFLFSNTLDCLRLSPAVSRRLNDAAIADFLIFGINQNPRTTSFRDIQRLPGGHSLLWSEGKLQVRQYWTLPVEAPLNYKNPEEYVEHFHNLLDQSVRDRLRTDRAGVLMSGGLDSTGLAATAQEILREQTPSFDLRAYTVIFERLIPDDERHFARLAADALRIPIHFQAIDNYGLFEGWNQPGFQTPEPCSDPTGPAKNRDQFKQVSSHSRVALCGEGPDNGLYYEWRTYFLAMLKTLRWGQLSRELKWHFRAHGWSRIGSLPKWRPTDKESNRPFDAGWLRPEIRDLVTVQKSRTTPHPFHPNTHRWMAGPLWDSLFSTVDPAMTRVPVEVRHPYMDIRLVRFWLAVPRIPWCRDKYLIRQAFRGVLPEAVLQRRKTPVQGDVLNAHIAASGSPKWVPEPGLLRYIDPVGLKPIVGSPYTWNNLLPLSLNFFLAFNGLDQ